ncbi:MAG: histone acetyltransferase 1 [Pycnora praestabilis]|nr:MAG: histone acetyltransferase 1 [Pycnora praestabilis]
MAEPDEWSTDANEAIQVLLVRPGKNEVKTVQSFHPRFTYPIFGEEERVFGYQGLKINLRFAVHDLQSNVETIWDKKFKPVRDTEATDLREILRESLPPTAFEKTTKFTSHIQSDASAKDFKPPGKLSSTYTTKRGTFEIWSGNLADPAVQQLLKRMQIFVSFFIEGGTYLNLDDPEWTIDRWKVFFLYEKLPAHSPPTASSYSLIGYATSYRNYLYTPTGLPSPPSSPPKRISPSATHTFTLPLPSPPSPTSLPNRERISQFIILPPYQGHGHGSHLYTALIKTFLPDPSVIEITVEDPNEAFDDLRDYCDLARLRTNPEFTKLHLNISASASASVSGQKRRGPRLTVSQILDQALLARLRTETKIAPRQFSRLVEMHLLSLIPVRHRSTARLTKKGNAADENDRAYYFWRLLVKQRLYRHNRDQLAQLDRLDRVDKLEETLGGVEGDYVRLLRGAKERVGEVRDGEAVLDGVEQGVDDDDEEGEEGEEGEGGNGEGRRNRAKRRLVVEDEDQDQDQDMDEGERTMKKAKI